MTNVDRKVIELALEALENLMNQHYAEQTTSNDLEKAEWAITAIKEALAQPEQDQDEVDIRSRLYQRIHELETQLAQPEDKKCENCGEFGECCQLAQPEQEPVGQLLENVFGRGQVMWFNKPKDESMLYTSPPQRKPLTDEQIAEMWLEILGSTPPSGIHEDGLQPWRFARAIEAAHGIKE